MCCSNLLDKSAIFWGIYCIVLCNPAHSQISLVHKSAFTAFKMSLVDNFDNNLIGCSCRSSLQHTKFHWSTILLHIWWSDWLFLSSHSSVNNKILLVDNSALHPMFWLAVLVTVVCSIEILIGPQFCLSSDDLIGCSCQVIVVSKTKSYWSIILLYILCSDWLFLS